MRLCEAYKFKRQALGMTQAEVAQLCHVSAATISKFEKGDELSPTVFNNIKYGIESHIRNLEPNDYMRIRLIENALSLFDRTSEDQIFVLQHMMVHAGKLSMNLLREINGEEEP